MERIPIHPKHKALMKPDVKYIWVLCPECGCEWECTERRKQALSMTPQGLICVNCFNKRKN